MERWLRKYDYNKLHTKPPTKLINFLVKETFYGKTKKKLDKKWVKKSVCLEILPALDVSQLTIRRPLPLRSGHLDVKDVQCAKKMMGVTFHVTSYCVSALWVFKRGVMGARKLNFLHKWLKFQRRLELIWRSFFCI